MEHWSNDGVFYLEGKGYALTPALKTVCIGEEKDLIEEHPYEVKETSTPYVRRHRMNKRGGKR